MLAELLGMPQVSFAKKVEVDGSNIKVHRQTSDGYQVVEVATPLSSASRRHRGAALRLAEGIMAARFEGDQADRPWRARHRKGEPAETIQGRPTLRHARPAP